MDVNGTTFHLLLGRSDWLGSDDAAAAPSGLTWNDERHSLTLERRDFRFPARFSQSRLAPSDRRGAGVDRYGNWFWIDGTKREIRVLPSAGTQAVTYWRSNDPTWCVDGESATDFAPGSSQQIPPDFGRLAGLAVTTHHYLVVGAPDLSAVVIFDLHGGGPPTTVPFPTGQFSPIDIAPCSDGGVWILDTADPGQPRYWGLDRHFRGVDLGGAVFPVAPEPDFRPKDGGDVVVRPSVVLTVDELLPGFAAPLDSASLPSDDPVSIEALPDGSVLVLWPHGPTGGFEIQRFRAAAQQPFEVPPDGPTTLFATAEVGAGLVGHDFAFVPAGDNGLDEIAGTLYLIDDQGDQVFAFEVSADGQEVATLDDYYPLRLFSGRAIVVYAGVVHYDLGERWFPIAARNRASYASRGVIELPPRDATEDVPVFDGGEPGTTWHRLFIDGCIPPRTKVVVDSRAADDSTDLQLAEWVTEPDLYLRSGGAEIPYHFFPGDGSAPAGAGTWELLFQRARGRFLQIRLSLGGDERRSPRLWALRVHSPRFSYLDEYLPDVFRAEPVAASFLDRYLANVEGTYTDFEGRVADSQTLFDPDTVCAEYLAWLAGWLGAVLEPDWDEARRRLFIRHAAAMFSRRGTMRGLREAIRLAVDPCPDERIFEPLPQTADPFGVRVVESFLTRDAPGVVFGDPTDLAGPRTIAVGTKWTLEEGGERLEQRYRETLEALYTPSTVEPPDAPTEAALAALNAAQGREYRSVAEIRFPPLTPIDGAERRVWKDFVAGQLDMGYADVGDADVGIYRTFLAQRYRRVDDLNTAWNRLGSQLETGFDSIALPVELPDDGSALQDWIQFVSLVAPTIRRAHRFSVMVPLRPDEAEADREARVSKVTRVVELEKPSHSSAQIKTYLAAFTVGEARIGYDTVIGASSRYVSMLLGRDRLAQATLHGAHPWHVTDRSVIGRDRIGPSPAPLHDSAKGDSS